MTWFISKAHETIRNARATRRGASVRPDEAVPGRHKSYPRMPRILLPKPEQLERDISSVMSGRRSFRVAKSLRPFSSDQIGTLLGTALGVSERRPFRHYPSGGALFPIETYLLGSVVEGLPRAAFHYNPSAHALEHLWDLPTTFSTLDMTTTHGAPAGSALMIFAARWDRSSIKYGDLAYLHGVIEAGHMAQNVLLVSTAMDMSARPVAGFRDGEISTALDLDENEQPVYAIILSPNPATGAGDVLSE